MQTKLTRWACSLLTVVGAVLVAAFFLDWIKGGISGIRIAWEDKHWLFLVPLSGLGLALTAGSRSAQTRLAAIVAGLLVAGDVVAEMFDGLLHSGLDTWLLLGGAAVVLAGIDPKRKSLRAAGGVAILLAFFAPWEEASTFKILMSSDADFIRAFGIHLGVLWLVGIAGVTAIVSALTAKKWGTWVAAASGIAVYGSFLWLIGSVANVILAWGAWATLGASALALVLGVLAPGERVTAVAATPAKP